MPTITKSIIAKDFIEHSPGTILNNNSNLSIVIPSYNSNATVFKLIESISNSNEKPYEVIIVDDCSKDDTVKKISESYSWVRIVQLNKNSGPSHARNIGAILAKKDIILFLDSDVILTPTSIEIVEKKHKENPNVAGYQGRYHWEAANPGLFQSYKALINHYWHLNNKESTRINFLVTYACTIKKDILFEVGGFNEAYKGADVEDYELGYRITKKYELLHEPKLEVYHHFPGFIKNTKNYIDRGSKWFSLFIKNKRFDSSGATSRSEAISRFLGGLSFLTFFTAFLSKKMSILFVCISALYVLVNYRFFFFSFQKKGVKYLLLGIIFHYISSIVICLTMLSSFFKYVLSKKGPAL